MPKRITDLDHLEQQLHEVEERLKQAVTLLNNLKTIQERFKDLTGVYKSTRQHLSDSQAELHQLTQDFTTTIQDAQQQVNAFEARYQTHSQQAEARLQKLYGDADTLNERTTRQYDDLTKQTREGLTQLYTDADELVQRTETRVDTLVIRINEQLGTLQRDQDIFRNDLRSDLKQAEDNLNLAFRNLRGDVERDASTLRGDVEKRVAAARADIDETIKTTEASLDRVRAAHLELKAQVTQRDQQMGYSYTTLKKDVDQLRKDLDVKSRQVRSAQLVGVLGAVMAAAATLIALLR